MVAILSLKARGTRLRAAQMTLSRGLVKLQAGARPPHAHGRVHLSRGGAGLTQVPVLTSAIW